MKYVTIRMTREDALAYGLLKCGTCGYPENNHFDGGGCAHDPMCKKYKEVARREKIVKRKK
jgi:hypothetical protein